VAVFVLLGTSIALSLGYLTNVFVAGLIIGAAIATVLLAGAAVHRRQKT